MAELDFVAARAGYGLAYRCTPPAVGDAPVVELAGARHPLLLANRRPEEVVPIDFTLGEGFVGMVISGPNNGGKTVALKTAGLLAAMALAGIPVPAAESSAVGRFAHIFADIGDESSIEGNLSTFTAHMANVRRFLASADDRTLVLLDEIGVGTSPKYGVAIAKAVLKRLTAAGARVVCTTHYDELKVFAEDAEGFVNAAVEADPETLEPTYVLHTGRPGSSEALAILRRLSFPADVVENVVSALGAEEVSLAALLSRLEEREGRAAALAAELEGLRDEYARKAAELEEERNRYDTHAARLREEAYDQATRVLREARRQANIIIRELRQQQDVAAAEELRRQLLEGEKDAAARREREAAAGGAEAGRPGDLTAGSWVSVRGAKARGQVVEVDEGHGRARVRFGGVEVWVAGADLTPASPPDRKGGLAVKGDDNVPPSLNLIGATVEEAMVELARYLDRAVVARLPSVEIIHGHGTGRLRAGVRQYLRSHPAVASHGPGAGNNEGVTVAQLRLP